MAPTPRLPAEWQPQSGVMLTWPQASVWGETLAAAEQVFAAIAAQISRFEQVLISCRDAAACERVAALLTRPGTVRDNIRLYPAASNDSWVRDHGPITVIESGGPRLLDFTFNGWGRKFSAELDNRLTRALHVQGAFGRVPLSSSEFVLEGGSIDSDGAGTLLTTARCLLSPMRNPDYDRARIEGVLARCLGAQRVLWLEHGYLAGDDTDSHIDMLARFCGPDTIAHVLCDDPADEHYEELRAMQAELAALRTAAGKPYRLVPLPLPRAQHAGDGRRLPASYANFLIINGALLVPVYNDPADTVAGRRLQACFPDRELIEIPALPLITQNGSLHCVTMQLPAGVLKD